MRPRTQAPGLLRVRRRHGVEYWWSASRACKKPAAKDFLPRTVRLEEPTEEARAQKCRNLTAEVLAWLKDADKSSVERFDGTIKSLNRFYETHEESPFHAVSHATRETYADEAKVLVDAVGDRRIDYITGAELSRWFKNFKKPAKKGAPERLRRAQGAMKALRRIASWGLQNRLRGCRTVVEILHEARFEVPAAREVAPSYAQIVAFIARAHERKKPSIALAAALMFDTSLRQTDIIGKWEPAKEGQAAGGYMHRGRRWGGGLVWQDIKDGVLVKKTTKNGAKAQFEIATLPLAVAEIARVPEENRIGPMIVDEATVRPYRHRWFARWWRIIADEAGIPPTIWSRDTRAGAITEAFDAGAHLEGVRQMATHSDPKVTGRYNRGSTTQTAAVSELRNRFREGREQ